MRFIRCSVSVLMVFIMVLTMFAETSQAKTCTLTTRLIVTVMRAPEIPKQGPEQSIPYGVEDVYEKFRSQAEHSAFIKTEYPSGRPDNATLYTVSERL